MKKRSQVTAGILLALCLGIPSLHAATEPTVDLLGLQSGNVTHAHRPGANGVMYSDQGVDAGDLTGEYVRIRAGLSDGDDVPAAVVAANTRIGRDNAGPADAGASSGGRRIFSLGDTNLDRGDIDLRERSQ